MTTARPIGICHCTACRQDGRTLLTEWFIAQVRKREPKRLDRWAA